MDDDDKAGLKAMLGGNWGCCMRPGTSSILIMPRVAKRQSSPMSAQTGGAVSQHHVGQFANRLLALPRFLGGACPRHDWVAGLDLTGHFYPSGFCRA